MLEGFGGFFASFALVRKALGIEIEDILRLREARRIAMAVRQKPMLNGCVCTTVSISLTLPWHSTQETPRFTTA